MKTAFTIWEDRISPVFDTAQHVLLVDIENGVLGPGRMDMPLPQEPVAKIAHLKEAGVSAVVCGAISRPLAQMAEERGIHVSPFVSGDIESVLRAYLHGELAQPVYCMPGCRGGQGRGRHGRGGGHCPCVCTVCGHQEPHRRGHPCNQQKCPKCGHTMVRAHGPVR